MDYSDRFEAQARALFIRIAGVSLDDLADTNAIGEAMPCDGTEPGSAGWIEALGDALSNAADCDYLSLPDEIADDLRAAADTLWGRAATLATA